MFSRAKVLTAGFDTRESKAAPRWRGLIGKMLSATSRIVFSSAGVGAHPLGTPVSLLKVWGITDFSAQNMRSQRKAARMMG